MKKTSIGARTNRENGTACNVGVKEENFLNQVIDLARIYGWRIAHFRPARTEKGWRTAVSGDGKGFPDCVLTKDGRTIIVELKTDKRKSKLSKDQARWLWELRKTEGLEVYVWRPRHWEYRPYRPTIAEILHGTYYQARRS